jgi:ATP-dependent Clp protease ATP-binding subunit ClpC
MLLALLREPEGTAAGVLASFGVNHEQVREAVIRMMGVGADGSDGEVSFTGRAQDAIERARREASVRDQPVGTEHILLALVHERNGAAARILLQLDADPAAISAAIAGG